MTNGEFAVAVTTLSGAALCVLAALIYRRWETPGRTALAAFVGLLGLSGVGTGPVALATGTSGTTLWLTTCAEVATVAWVAFAVQYTGRASQIGRSTAILGVAAYLLFAFISYPLGLVVENGDVLGFLAISGYMVGLIATLVATTLVLETTYRHGYLSGWVGVALAFVAVDPWFLTMVGWATQGEFPAALLYGLYAGGFVAYVLVLGVVLWATSAPTVTPATATVGRRAALAETTDLVVIVDGDGRIVDANDTARDRLGVAAPGGRQIVDVLSADIETLQEGDSVELSTDRGLRQYDAAVVELTDRGPTSVGWLVSLRDVTERRQREQVLDVLNRLLRHNIRNDLDVAKAQTNFVADAVEDPALSEHLGTAVSSVNSVLDLAEKARATQRTLERERGVPTDVSVRERVADVASEAEQALAGDVTVDGDEVMVRTDADLFELAVRNVVENALEHSESDEPTATVTVTDTGDGVRVRVDDDGPGIPETETTAIREGEETDVQHATGLGLWLVEWATTTCGGTVTFGESPTGGRVDLWFPHQN